MFTPPERPAIVYPVLGLGLLAIASSPILVRFAEGAPALTIAFWRTTLAVLMLAPVALPRIQAEVRGFTRREMVLIVGAGILLAFHFILWIESLQHTSVASASVLVTTSPIFLAVFGYLFLKERLSVLQVAAIGVAICGAALIGFGDASGDGAPSAALGNALSLIAAVLVSFYLLIGRVVRRGASWLAYVFPLYVVVALTIFVVVLLRGTPLFGLEARFYGFFALMALGPQIIGHGSFNYAIRYFTPAMLGLLSLLEPVGASIMAYLLFNESPGVLTIGGMALVLVAVTAALKPRRTGEPAAGAESEASVKAEG